jgi:ferrous iron transport protein A
MEMLMKEIDRNIFGFNNQTISTTHPQGRNAGRVLPLSMVQPGEKVQVRSVSGKDETRRFLSTIGFIEDAEVTVITEISGNVIVNIKGTRVAISKSMASRVLTM